MHLSRAQQQGEQRESLLSLFLLLFPPPSYSRPTSYRTRKSLRACNSTQLVQWRGVRLSPLHTAFPTSETQAARFPDAKPGGDWFIHTGHVCSVRRRRRKKTKLRGIGKEREKKIHQGLKKEREVEEGMLEKTGRERNISVPLATRSESDLSFLPFAHSLTQSPWTNCCVSGSVNGKREREKCVFRFFSPLV